MNIIAEDNIAKTESSDNNDQVPVSNTKLVEKNKYEVVSIEKIDTPDGMAGDHWHRYVIGEGGGKIEGLKEGSLKEVTSHAEKVAEDLNTRSKGKVASHLSRKQHATPPKPPAPASSTS